MKKKLFEPGIHTTIKLCLHRTLILIIFYSALQTASAQDTTMQAIRQQAESYLKEYPVLWQQTSAEYRALCYQAFNIAELRLNEILKKKPYKKNLAIITDLDETILDNSNTEAQKIKEGKEINYAEWQQWINKPAIPTVPGGVKFLQSVSKKGITVFYISNRDVKGLQVTLSLLQKLKLPNADTAHMLFLSSDFSKEPRRQTVMKDYNVLLLLGDNLNDFMNVFEKKPIEERLAETDKVKAEWGKKFIVLPNAVYGEWENALYNYQHNISPQQKEIMRKNLLKGYE